MGMLLIVGTIRLPEGNLAGARPLMRRMIEASRAEAGCEEYSYAEDVFEPGLIRVMELWRDQAALDRHFGSDHIKQWRACWTDWGIRDRNLRVYEVAEPRAT
jgi:quinol monooxygenase YgiN